MLALVATGACSRGGLSETLGGGKDVEVRRGSAPRAVSAQGTSLVVKSLESNDKGLTIELLAINGDDDDLRLSSEYEGLVLEDDTGVKHPAREEEIELRPGTATVLRLDFAGPLPGGARRLALRVESPSSSKLDIEDIPAPGSGRLEKIAQLARFYGKAQVLVLGFTDDKGGDDYNQALSERRAEAVKSYLVSNFGIDGGRVRTEGRGERDPVAPNRKPDGSDNPEGRQQNRRVEVVFPNA